MHTIHSLFTDITIYTCYLTSPGPASPCADYSRPSDVISRLLNFNLHPSASRSFLEAVQHVTGPESCITPAATPAGYAVEDQPTVVGSHEAASRTASTLLEIDSRANNKTASIKDTLDPDIEPSFGVQGPH